MPSLPVPTILRPWLGSGPQAALVFTAIVLVLVLAFLLVVWRTFGRGPRRRRALRRAQQLLDKAAWKEALDMVHGLQSQGLPAGRWADRLRQLEAACHNAAGAAFLAQKEYEKALEHFLQESSLLGASLDKARAAVVETMLTEARLLYAVTTGPHTAAVHTLLARILRVQSPCPEASFWQALYHLRDGHADLAATGLRTLAEGDMAVTGPAGRGPLDPLLYLGAVLLRQGEARQALRYLTEANRLDGNCPFVIAQLGTAMIEAGGDPAFAVRALQRALGPRGFQIWKQAPQRAWVEGLPENSYVRRLAGQQPFVCPLWGSDLQALFRQAGLALGEGLYRQGNYQEAANVYTRILEEGAPSFPVLRGLGLTLARLERFDQAFKHLRAAHELAPDDRAVAGHLALCGARGKPLRPEDRANNLAWAVWLLGRYSAPGDADWAALASTVFAEARDQGVPVAVADQVNLCEQLLALRATDPLAAAAYHHLQATDPASVRPEYAWLYCWAARLHGPRGEHALELFGRTFKDEGPARAFFAGQGWDMDQVEFTYLALAAERAPGHFPEALGPAYPPRGANLLLAQSARLEEAGQPDAALAAAEILVQLDPANAPAQDRLAGLHYRAGNRERSLELLQAWARLEPANPLPWLRQAVIRQQAGDLTGCAAALHQALTLTQGKLRAEVAFLGARLTLAWLFAGLAGQHPSAPDPEQATAAWQQAAGLFDECLRADPDHVAAQWSAAAVRALTGDREGLAAQAPAMHRPEVADPRFHYLAGVCRLAVGDSAGVLEACQRTAADPALAADSAYLMGWAYLQRREPATAALAFQRVAEAADSPSAGHALAILGGIRFHQGAYDEAAHEWQRLDEMRRKTWGFDEALAGATFLAALKDLREGRFEQAASRFRDAGHLGRRDRRLGPLLSLALFRAGQELLYRPDAGQAGEWEKAARFLEQALKTGNKDLETLYLLALAYKRQGKTAEARAALRKVTPADANVLLQLGLLALSEGQFAQAEEDLARAADMDPTSYEIAYDLLLARLALGQLSACAALVPKVLPLAPTPEDKRLLALLGALVQRTLATEPTLAPTGADEQTLPINGAVQEAILASMPRAQEQRLLQLLCGLGRLEAVFPLLGVLAEARPNSPAVQEAHLELILIQATRLAERCQWSAAVQRLQPLARLLGAGAAPGQTTARPIQVALFNLLGVCASMSQEFADGARHFAAALQLAGKDVWLQQNLALAYELQERLDLADASWERYFDLLDNRTPAPDLPNYHENLAFEGLTRLTELYTKREKWSAALPFAQRAQRLRPRDAETLERLFYIYQQTRRPEDARRTLRKLRELRPEDPQYELFELDVRDVRTLDDIDRMMGDVQRILTQHPGDMRVEERAVAMIGNVIPSLQRQSAQHSARLARVVEQVRTLPSYQVNWPVVHDEMRRLGREFQKLRKLAHKCLALVTHPDQRRAVKELVAQVDNKLEVCESLRG